MIVPNLKGITRALLEPQNYTETLTSTFEATASLFAGNTGIFGRRSCRAAVLNDRGPRRSTPTAVTAEQRAFSPTETVKAGIISSEITSSITTAPIPTAQLELEKRQTMTCTGDYVYVSCADGSFNGCGNSAICGNVVTIRTTSTISVDGPSPTSSTLRTATNSAKATTTPTASSISITESSTPTTSNPAATTTAASSAGPPIGAIAGGAIGGVALLALLIFLLIFCIKRHRKKVEKRRLEASKPFFPKKRSTPPPPPPLHRAHPNAHQRTGSTSHDIYGTIGAGSLSSRTNFKQPEKGRLIDMHSLQANPAPGLRAEGGPGLPPAAFLRPAQMLDGKPINEIGGNERPRSIRSTTSGTRLQEYDNIAVEMEDTSNLRAAIPAKGIQHEQSPTLSQDSPVLGRNPPAFRSNTTAGSLASDVMKRQHLMSWTSYASDGDGEEMSATLNSAKSPPSARSSPSRVSEQSSGLRLSDATYVVSPLRKDKF